MNVLMTPSTCIDLNTIEYNFCLPVRTSCNTQPKDLLFAPCDELWNCNHCQVDVDYHNPYKEGDCIQFQTQIFDGFNADRENPTQGFGTWINVFVCTPDGNEVAATPFIKRSMVAYGCGRSYQILEIETTDMPPCWSLRYEVSGGDDNCCTQGFGLVDCDVVPTVLIQGKNEGVDCSGFCHDEPDNYFGDLIEYKNEFRVYGHVRDTNPEVVNVVSGSTYSTTTKTENIQVNLGRRIPPYAMREICRIMESGNICVDGEDYNIDRFVPANQINYGDMWLFNITGIYRTCESSKVSCFN